MDILYRLTYKFIIRFVPFFHRKRLNKQLGKNDAREFNAQPHCSACGESHFDEVAPGVYDCLACDFVGGPGYQQYALRKRLDSLETLSLRQRRALASDELSVLRIETLRLLPLIKSARSSVILCSLGGPFKKKFDLQEATLAIEQMLGVARNIERVAAYSESEALRDLKITGSFDSLLRAHISPDEPEASAKALRAAFGSLEKTFEKLPFTLQRAIHDLRS